jgi:hypothetical protein
VVAATFVGVALHLAEWLGGLGLVWLEHVGGLQCKGTLVVDPSIFYP